MVFLGFILFLGGIACQKTPPITQKTIEKSFVIDVKHKIEMTVKFENDRTLKIPFSHWSWHSSPDHNIIWSETLLTAGEKISKHSYGYWIGEITELKGSIPPKVQIQPGMKISLKKHWALNFQSLKVYTPVSAQIGYNLKKIE